MADFIAEVIGQEDTEEGNVVTVRMTGFGGRDGPMMTRAKAKAITVTRFGRATAVADKITNVFKGGRETTEKEELFADKSDDLFKGPESGVRERLKAFRKNGLFAEVQKSTELKTERVIGEGTLEEMFGPLAGVVNTYEYEILVTTRYALS